MSRHKAETAENGSFSELVSSFRDTVHGFHGTMMQTNEDLI